MIPWNQLWRNPEIRTPKSRGLASERLRTSQNLSKSKKKEVFWWYFGRFLTRISRWPPERKLISKKEDPALGHRLRTHQKGCPGASKKETKSKDPGSPDHQKPWKSSKNHENLQNIMIFHQIFTTFFLKIPVFGILFDRFWQVFTSTYWILRGLSLVLYAKLSNHLRNSTVRSTHFK